MLNGSESARDLNVRRAPVEFPCSFFQIRQEISQSSQNQCSSGISFSGFPAEASLASFRSLAPRLARSPRSPRFARLARRPFLCLLHGHKLQDMLRGGRQGSPRSPRFARLRRRLFCVCNVYVLQGGRLARLASLGSLGARCSVWNTHV